MEVGARAQSRETEALWLLRASTTQDTAAKQGPESDLLGLGHQVEVKEGLV